MTYPEIDDLINLVIAVAGSSQAGPMDLLKLEKLLDGLDEAALTKLALLLRLREEPEKPFEEKLDLAQRAVNRLLPRKKPGGSSGGGEDGLVAQMSAAWARVEARGRTSGKCPPGISRA